MPGSSSRMWLVLGGAGLAALIVAGVNVASDEPKVEVSAGGGARSAPMPPQGGRVAWAEAGDVWLYQPSMEEPRRLTGDGDAWYDHQPRFHGPDRVTFLAHAEAADPSTPGTTMLREVDLTTGRVRDLRRLGGGSFAFDWSPDGWSLALYSRGGDGTPGELRFTTDGRPAATRSFGPVWGRGGFVNYDELRVEWAPDGKHLIVIDTGLDTSQDETLYVLNPDGSDAMAPRGGTWARWGVDGRTVYCSCAAHPGDQEWSWQAVDIRTGTGAPLIVKRGMRPSVSPDGSFLAFDDGEDTPSVHVLDLRTPGSLPRRVVGAAMAPRWLGPDRLVVTDTRSCPDDPETCEAGGHGSMFHPAGTVAVLDVASGERRQVVAGSTEDADAAPPAP